MVKYLDLELHFGTQKNPSEYNVPTCVCERGCLCACVHNAYVIVHTVCLHILCVWMFLPQNHLHTTTSQFLPSVSNMNTSSSWAMCVKPTMALICFWSVVPLTNDSSVTAIGTSLTHLSPILEMMYLEIHWKSWYGHFLLLSSLFLPWSLSSHSSFLPLPLCVNHFVFLPLLCFPHVSHMMFCVSFSSRPRPSVGDLQEERRSWDSVP